jgi:hypothetical protein
MEIVVEFFNELIFNIISMQFIEFLRFKIQR